MIIKSPRSKRVFTATSEFIVDPLSSSDTTVQKALVTLNNAIDDIDIAVEPEVILSGGSINEIGLTIDEVVLSWTCNKNMISRTLSSPVPIEHREQGEGKNGSYIHQSANLTSNTTYSLTVADSEATSIATTSVLFYSKLYYGESIEPSLTNSEILALNGILSNNRNISFTSNPSGKYIYFAYPVSYGGATFYVNGSITSAWGLDVKNITNAQGYVRQYNVYRTNTLQYGTNIQILVV